MSKIRKAKLDLALDRARLVSGADLELDWGNGGVRVCDKGGSRDLSPRGSKRETYNWIQAFMTGVQLGREKP